MSLQPLRIPGGWEIVFNKLIELEPENISESDEQVWISEFVEDILYIRQQRQKRKDNKTVLREVGVDLGWYPEGDPAGSFCLTAVKDGDWENPLHELKSRSKSEIVCALEEWLTEFSGDWWSKL